MNIRQGGRRPVDHARPSSSPPSIRAIHTHYDGQATWDEELAPSTPHGVTTVVTGKRSCRARGRRRRRRRGSRASAVGHSVEGRTDLLTTADTELAEPPPEDGLRHYDEVVEGGDAVVVDPFVDSDGDAGWDRPDCAGHGSDDDVVEYRDDFIARHDEHGTSLLVRGLHEPEFALSYQGSASVMAVALAIARSSSSLVWGRSRYDAAMSEPTRARRTRSARCWTPWRMTADRLSPTPCLTRSSMRASSSSLNRVGTGVVIRCSIRFVYQRRNGANPLPGRAPVGRTGQ